VEPVNDHQTVGLGGAFYAQGMTEEYLAQGIQPDLPREQAGSAADHSDISRWGNVTEVPVDEAVFTAP
jgi:hypothetical protein